MRTEGTPGQLAQLAEALVVFARNDHELVFDFHLGQNIVVEVFHPVAVEVRTVENDVIVALQHLGTVNAPGPRVLVNHFLTERLRKTDDMLKYISVHNEQMRFIHYLSDKGRKNDKGTGEYIDTGIDIQGKEITNMIGLSSNKIKEFLNRLTKYNIVELQDTIIIKSMEKLNKYQDFIALQEEFER